MESKIKQTPHPLVWAAGIAIIVFCAAGIAAIMGWIPTSSSQTGSVEAAAAPETAAAVAASPPVAKSHKTTHARAESTQAMSSRCNDCGIIESVQEIETKGQGSGLGVVGGAVVGGLLGHQVGDGRGRDLATIAGAVGGGYAGNEVEKRSKSTKSYDITVRMNEGGSRVFHEAALPNWRNGDHVKIVDGSIRAN